MWKTEAEEIFSVRFGGGGGAGAKVGGDIFWVRWRTRKS